MALRVRVRQIHKTVGCTIRCTPRLCPRCALLLILQACELRSDFYPAVKAALHHESVDSEEDCEGLGCHLGQGLDGMRVKCSFK